MKTLKVLFYYCSIFVLALVILCANIENGVLLSFLSFGLIFLFVKYVPLKRFAIFLTIFCLFTKIAAIFFVDTPITGDFVLMYDTAKHIVMEGIYTAKHSYFDVWGYQLFHVFYEAFMLTIFNSVTFLKILNCCYSTIITLLLYLIVKKMTNEQTARITSLLYAISLYPLYLNTILGNQQLGLMLALIGVYLLLYYKQSLKTFALVGILFGVSQLERNEGVIYLLSSIIYLFLSNQSIKDFGKKVLVLLFCFLFITKGTSFLVKSLQINDIGLGNSNPEWKFLLGFNYETNGVYDINDEIYLGNLTMQKDEILRRVWNIQKWPGLFYNKIRIQFLYDEFGKSFDQDFGTSSLGKLKTTTFEYVKVMNFFVIFLALIGAFKNETLKRNGSFFLINFLLFFGVYMLIEICARYYFYPQLTIFLLSSFGIERLLKLFRYISNEKIFRLP